MRWRKVDNSTRLQPTAGQYSDWKTEVCQACYERCVYCGIAVNRYGGIDNYHVDHFRPKSLTRFQHLERVIANLYLACAICNRFKSNDWPNDPIEDHSLPSYVDPGENAYTDLFKVDLITFIVEGRYPAAIYMIEKLGLNRSQLILDRRMDALVSKCEQQLESIRSLVEILQSTDSSGLHGLLIELVAMQNELAAKLLGVVETRPYEPGDQRRGSDRAFTLASDLPKRRSDAGT